MEKFDYKKLIPYVVAILAFVLISLIYFTPALEGKKLKQGDIDRFKGMSREITDHNKRFEDNTLWTNSMFGGMPAYFISVQFDGNLFKKINKALHELEEVAEDTNMQPYTRTQIWNVVSLLELC